MPNIYTCKSVCGLFEAHRADSLDPLSGLRAACNRTHSSRKHTQAFISYLYGDALPANLDPPALAELLHVGAFHGNTR